MSSSIAEGIKIRSRSSRRQTNGDNDKEAGQSSCQPAVSTPAKRKAPARRKSPAKAPRSSEYVNESDSSELSDPPSSTTAQVRSTVGKSSGLVKSSSTKGGKASTSAAKAQEISKSKQKPATAKGDSKAASSPRSKANKTQANTVAITSAPQTESNPEATSKKKATPAKPRATCSMDGNAQEGYTEDQTSKSLSATAIAQDNTLEEPQQGQDLKSRETLTEHGIDSDGSKQELQVRDPVSDSENLAVLPSSQIPDGNNVQHNQPAGNDARALQTTENSVQDEQPKAERRGKKRTIDIPEIELINGSPEIEEPLAQYPEESELVRTPSHSHLSVSEQRTPSHLPSHCTTPGIDQPSTPELYRMMAAAEEAALWRPSENNPRCPNCVKLIGDGAPREDVKCMGGPPCQECAMRNLDGNQCRSGNTDVEYERAPKRIKVAGNSGDF